MLPSFSSNWKAAALLQAKLFSFVPRGAVIRRRTAVRDYRTPVPAWPLQLRRLTAAQCRCRLQVSIGDQARLRRSSHLRKASYITRRGPRARARAGYKLRPPLWRVRNIFATTTTGFATSVAGILRRHTACWNESDGRERGGARERDTCWLRTELCLEASGQIWVRARRYTFAGNTDDSLGVPRGMTSSWRSPGSLRACRVRAAQVRLPGGDVTLLNVGFSSLFLLLSLISSPRLRHLRYILCW